MTPPASNEWQSNFSVQVLNAELINILFPVTIFIGIEAVVGFLGNALILCVYAKLYLHCNFRYFVLFLAVYDLTSCVTSLPGEIFSEFHWYDYTCNWHCKMKSYFNVFTVWGSAFTLLLLGFDRYRKVCSPLGRQIQPSLALKLCGAGMVVSASVSTPALVLWGIRTYVHSVGDVNVTVSICEKSGTYATGSYPFIYVTFVYIVPIGSMMVAISVWNTLIARKLFCRSLGIRSNANRTERHCGKFMRNESDSSDIARPGFNFKFTLSDFRGVFCGSPFLRSARRSTPARTNSVTSISSCELRELPTKEKFYILTTEQETTIPNTEPNCSCSDTLIKQISHNSSGSTVSQGGGIAAEEIPNGTIFRRKRKTLIMLVLTSVFIITISVYIILISIIARNQGILKHLSNTEKVTLFFFLRIYFINCLVNPVLYGLLDPRFRRGLKRIFCACRLFQCIKH